ncbi:class I SAM-dependent DNA methyltransferase [Actinoallomurus sp. CA-150999]|uniref:class I SAM-dependent DNA methyltransferase n=1 Tax=Actinoallomurus sp. CA-150999 TaxID=3239887 RepID=UPI003D8B775C
MREPSFLRTVQAAYDTYGEASRAGLDDRPLDRAMLSTFADLVRAEGTGRPIADLGAGPGHVTAHLDALGLDVYGVDLSPAMVTLARRTHPHLRFVEGTMTALDVADEALGGIVAWYSVIHIPTERLPELFAEFHRALAPGGHILLVFQTGDEPLHLARAFGHDVSLVFHRWPIDRVSDLLRQAGFTEVARMTREPTGATEKVRRGYVLAVKPAGPARA